MCQGLHARLSKLTDDLAQAPVVVGCWKRRAELAGGDGDGENTPVLRGSWGQDVGQKPEKPLPLGPRVTVPVLVVRGRRGRASVLAFPLPPKRGLGPLLGSEIGPFSNMSSASPADMHLESGFVSVSPFSGTCR